MKRRGKAETVDLPKLDCKGLCTVADADSARQGVYDARVTGIASWGRSSGQGGWLAEMAETMVGLYKSAVVVGVARGQSPVSVISMFKKHLENLS